MTDIMLIPPMNIFFPRRMGGISVISIPRVALVGAGTGTGDLGVRHLHLKVPVPVTGT